MRHNKKFNHLGRKSAHRKAMLSNMASSLILNKRIITTVAKAKALRMYVEPLITRSKEDNTSNRRLVFSYLQNKYAVTELFREISTKVAERPGGYTRIIRMPNMRAGDAADMCMMEMVDYNDVYTAEAKKPAKAKTTRRSKKSAPKAEAAVEAPAEAPVETPAEKPAE
ncbi:MAG: 50S ribosomal protein L17 [Bacteroidales bacterium]|jgi:large subunit ribosomal protein L17|nr:50S ribosomal protein L17 [Bacteroidales bacterium]MBQ6101385.1 50S ribosomal protein L17 [Bacteroidales bacterium]MBR6847486.1 50S ribosomal protein L17 [Bacteroidales bacterium]